jgi:hypothetical protein
MDLLLLFLMDLAAPLAQLVLQILDHLLAPDSLDHLLGLDLPLDL